MALIAAQTWWGTAIEFVLVVVLLGGYAWHEGHRRHKGDPPDSA